VNYLIDTNVLVYALDAGEPERAGRAREWLELLVAADQAALSAQALTELANVCLHRLDPRWSPAATLGHLSDLAQAVPVLPVTQSVVLEALRGVQDHQLSFFDAQMWASARLNQIPYLLTQDMASGATIAGVTMVDPFAVEPPVGGRA
jgi:predicted nucleic acid-binding protein